MKYGLLIVFLLVVGCNGVSVQYDSGAHWGIAESPVLYKCVEIQATNARIGNVGLMSFLYGEEIAGENVSYKSYGKMCAQPE